MACLRACKRRSSPVHVSIMPSHLVSLAPIALCAYVTAFASSSNAIQSAACVQQVIRKCGECAHMGQWRRCHRCREVGCIVACPVAGWANVCHSVCACLLTSVLSVGSQPSSTPSFCCLLFFVLSTPETSRLAKTTGSNDSAKLTLHSQATRTTLPPPHHVAIHHIMWPYTTSCGHHIMWPTTSCGHTITLQFTLQLITHVQARAGRHT